MEKINIYFHQTTRQIQCPSGGFDSLSLAPGDTLYVTDSELNNGAYTIVRSNDSQIFVEEKLKDEFKTPAIVTKPIPIPPGGEPKLPKTWPPEPKAPEPKPPGPPKIPKEEPTPAPPSGEPTPPGGARGNINFYAGYNAIIDLLGRFGTLGLTQGDTIVVSGTEHNNGSYLVISATGRQINVGANLITELYTGASIVKIVGRQRPPEPEPQEEKPPPKPKVPGGLVIETTPYPKWWKDSRAWNINIDDAGTWAIINQTPGYRAYISTIVLTVNGETIITFNMGVFGASGPMYFGGEGQPMGIVIAMGNSPMPCGEGGFSITSSGGGVAVGGFINYFYEKE